MIHELKYVTISSCEKKNNNKICMKDEKERKNEYLGSLIYDTRANS